MALWLCVLADIRPASQWMMITKPRGKILHIGDPDLSRNKLAFIISPQAKRWIACILCDDYRNTITSSEAKAQRVSNSSGRNCRGPSFTTRSQNYSLGGQIRLGGGSGPPPQKIVVFLLILIPGSKLENACAMFADVIAYRIFLCWGTILLGTLCFHFGICLNLRVMN